VGAVVSAGTAELGSVVGGTAVGTSVDEPDGVGAHAAEINTSRKTAAANFGILF
jgi:hypothetical protein